MKKLCIVIPILMLTLTVVAQRLRVGDGTSGMGYRNPVLPGFHADPSVCRAGEDFYLVNSTFQYYPGVPVFHSKDLIHWEQVGACLTRESQVRIEGMDEQTGIYAPTIRYHEGRFYMVTTVFPSRKHFYVYTDDPNGEWSDPIYIDFCVGSCDPTLFFDNGKCYFLWKEGGWPVVNGDGTLQLDMQCQTLPQVPMPLEPTRDEFEADKLSFYWSHLNMPQKENYSLNARKGWLRMTTSAVSTSASLPILRRKPSATPTSIGRNLLKNSQ